MTDFTSALCPVCKKDFSRERPVVCPDCGAPYHRACYAEKGSCVFKNKHSASFAWENVSAEPPKPSQSDSPASAEHPSKEGNEKERKIYGTIRETLDEMGFFKDEHGGVKNNAFRETLSPDERFLFGVSEKEIANFQGGITPLRLLRYRKIASGNKISLNLFAGIFSPLYMFYSRMRGLGFIVALFTFLLSFPTWLDRYFSLTGAVTPFTQEQLIRLSANLSIFSLSLTVIIALFYDYFYLRWASNKIRFIRSRFYPEIMNDRPEIPDVPSVSPKLEGLDDDYYKYLQHVGNPGFRYMLRDFAITSAATLFLVHLFVNNFIAGG
jgi:hypothetical protein